jgi:hypothetical protein
MSTSAGFALDGSKWDGLYLGRRKGDDLIYAGKVDHSFDAASANDAVYPSLFGGWRRSACRWQPQIFR